MKFLKKEKSFSCLSKTLLGTDAVASRIGDYSFNCSEALSGSRYYFCFAHHQYSDWSNTIRGSQKALAALKKRLAINARVLRDGNWVTKEAREIVPGDIISVGLGDIVPADAKLISGDLSIDQSILTGESLPVYARESAIIYSGSVVKRGEAKCVVVNTGANTYFGKTAELVKTAKPKSHQEQIMLAIVKYMMFLGIGALILVAIYAVIIGTGILSILTFAIIFLMGAVPVLYRRCWL